jgi:hypothetical protein
MLGPTCDALRDFPLELGGLAEYMNDPLETARDLRVRLILGELLARRGLTIATTITFLRSLPAAQCWHVTPELTQDLADAFGRLLGENWTALFARLQPAGVDTLLTELRATTYWAEPHPDAQPDTFVPILCTSLALAYLCDV